MLMFRLLSRLLFFVLLLGVTQAFGQQKKAAFKVVPLGIRGGLDESNLSGYLVAPTGSDNYVSLDAGTLHYGLRKAVENRVFEAAPGEVLRNNVKGYLISHPHLDHLAGLIINSPDDTPKSIYGLPFMIQVLKDKYFTWQSWANFANEGDKPTLNKYQYTYLKENEATPLANTELQVRAFPLSHSSPDQSAAFLLQHNQDYLLYLGDTGADAIEGSDKLQQLWQEVAPLVKNGELKAIFIEVSFPNEQPEKQLFGHLTPRLLMSELEKLSKLTGTTALRKVPVVVTHMKPSGDNVQKIMAQLKEGNRLRLNLVYPEQGRMLTF
ncbi:3',5'-cyclic-nucleotide phosphodiesterase [Pontibacter ummariensis]|uniref:3',5'-cyclic-nucleotide phosphodiesterase n=2 Tax=Pontibacter ummariensis TaxID=1610492 RepID=A0A239I9D4_9BACT|nr:3',5'-cyclic-nucleotide phosphodiesterase [Pontibacter ummariensis]SNS89928.1 3',5'-cyclic-nucleotide phosphodiesterase [Pontibacter ummariensis]